MIDRKNKCPNCGAMLTGLELKCPECGYILTTETGGSQSTTESLQDLQDKLLAVDKIFKSKKASSKKKASIINTFPVPQTMESLTRLLHLSYSNYEATKEMGDKQLSMAWLGKAAETYRRLSENKQDPAVSEILSGYKILGDKKAFAKLSGSYSRKYYIWLALLVVAALLGVIASMFDWTGYLLKHGKTDMVVKHYLSKGKADILVEHMVKLEMYEEASELMKKSGQSVNAVGLLAQKGRILDAVILISKVNSADTIHSCVDEFSKYVSLSARSKYYLKDNLIVNLDKCCQVYDHNRFRIFREWDKKDSTVIWEDYWKIYPHIDIPVPHYFMDSPFIRLYRDHNFWGNVGKKTPDIIYNNQGRPVSIHLTNDQLVFNNEIVPETDLTFRFFYDTRGRHLTGEAVYYKDIPLNETIYEIGNSGLIRKVRQHCILEDAEDKDLPSQEDMIIITAMLKDLYIGLSHTHTYHYTNGRVSSIVTSRDFDNDRNRIDRVDGKYMFTYYDNLVIQSFFSVDDDTQEETLSPEHTVVSIYNNGELVEDFFLNANLHSDAERL